MAPDTPPRLPQTLGAGGPGGAGAGAGGGELHHLVSRKQAGPDTGDLGEEPVTGGVSSTVLAVDVVLAVLALVRLGHQVTGTLPTCPTQAELGVRTPTTQRVLYTLQAARLAGAAPVLVRLQVVCVEHKSSLSLL